MKLEYVTGCFMATMGWSIPATVACELVVEPNGSQTTIRLANNGIPFYTTTGVVTNPRCIEVPDTNIILGLWDEEQPLGVVRPWYAINLDGVAFSKVTRTSYELRLKYGAFDPLVSTPAIDPVLQADGSENLYIVQFVTQPLAPFRSAIETLGGIVRPFAANHGHMVEMSAATRTQVEALPYVRWVGPLHPAFRLSPLSWAASAKRSPCFPRSGMMSWCLKGD
jgi:hypothetical protein